MEDGVLHLPYWLLGYEALVSLFVDRSEENAPNQTMMMTRLYQAAKRAALIDPKYADILRISQSTAPFRLTSMQYSPSLKASIRKWFPERNLALKNRGHYFDKLSRLIARLKLKRQDRRLGFLFQPPDRMYGNGMAVEDGPQAHRRPWIAERQIAAGSKSSTFRKCHRMCYL